MSRPEIVRRDIRRASYHEPPPRYILGLDLGQAGDYTALTILHRANVYAEDDYDCKEPIETAYHLRHLQRFPLATPYPTIVREVAAIMSQPKIANNCRLVVDGTGVGSPVVDMFLQAGLRPVAIQITAGNNISRSGNYIRIPKRNLVSVLQVLLQTQRLKIAKEIPNLNVLVEELRNFRVKITAAGNDTYAAWRERDHDDCVLALAIACWYADNNEKRPKANIRFTALR